MDREGQMETNKLAEEVTKVEKTKEDLEEETFAAINGYLTASANEERYPSTYSKDQKRELRRKAKRFATKRTIILLYDVPLAQFLNTSGLYILYVYCIYVIKIMSKIDLTGYTY